MFDVTSKMAPESVLNRWLRRIIGLGTACLLLLGAIGSYRAWVQVFDVSVLAPDSVLVPGTMVQVHVATSGRTYVQLRLELLQDGLVDTLALDEIPKNGDAGLDPRPQRRAIAVTLPPALWIRFHAGPALLRATALGRPQWLRTPPPTVCELSVTLR